MSPSTMSLEITHGVLLTLQRLESTLDGIDERLRVLELSTAGGLSLQRHKEPVPMCPIGAADFQKSVQRLRQLYEFDSQSSLNLPGSNPAAFDKFRRTSNDEHSILDTRDHNTDIGGYCRPVSSVYASREFDATPVETPGKRSSRFSAQETTSVSGDSSVADGLGVSRSAHFCPGVLHHVSFVLRK